MNIGNSIRRRRLELGMSQDDLARALGYRSRSAISKIEKGENDIPVSKLCEIAAALDTSPSYLLEGPTKSNAHTALNPGVSEHAKSRSAVAVILAGGKSTRNKSTIPNQFINVLGKPVILYCMRAYQNHPAIEAIYVVCTADWGDIVKAYCSEFGITKMAGVIPAGTSGVGSAYNAVRSLTKSGLRSNDLVFFQEATRPFVSEETISALLSKCNQSDGSIVAQARNDNIQFFVDNDTVTYLDRKKIVDIQSPEAHTLESLNHLFDKAIAEKHPLRESCLGMLMYSLGIRLHFCESADNNLKLIRKEDVAIFETLLRSSITF